MVTIEILQKEIESLKQQAIVAEATINMASGAIQLAEMLIKKLQEPDEKSQIECIGPISA